MFVKTVSNAIANYTMNCFRIPKSVLSSIDRLQSRFWWGHSYLLKEVYVGKNGLIFVLLLRRGVWASDL